MNNMLPDQRIKVKFHTSVFAKLRAYFLTGILVTAPIAITLYATWFLLRLIDTQVRSLIPEEYLHGVAVPGMGLLIAVSFFILVGWLAKNILGRIIIQVSEYALDRMPIIRKVYSALKQVFETVMGSQSQAFREVVMYEFPGKGIWALGFVTGVTQGAVQNLLADGDEIVNVFFPAGMNPTSGFVFMIPRKSLIALPDMTTEDAFKLIISGGILTPPAPAQVAVK
jgi:uncharacterized membrane protein